VILVLFDESSIILADDSRDFFKLCVEELNVPTVIKDNGRNRPIPDLTWANYIFSTLRVYDFGMFCLQKP
jgi:hypothetical protein